MPLDHVASLMSPTAVSSPHLGSSDSHKHQEPLYSAWCETRTLWSLPLLNLLAHLGNGGTSKHSLLLRPQDSRGDAGRPASLSCMQQALSARGRLLTPPACQRCARRAVRAAPVGSAWAGACRPGTGNPPAAGQRAHMG